MQHSRKKKKADYGPRSLHGRRKEASESSARVHKGTAPGQRPTNPFLNIFIGAWPSDHRVFHINIWLIIPGCQSLDEVMTRKQIENIVI
jgi:hypothetical protein